jgi:hypothetical protein
MEMETSPALYDVSKEHGGKVCIRDFFSYRGVNPPLAKLFILKGWPVFPLLAKGKGPRI